MALRFCDSFDHYATADIPGKYSDQSGAIITAGVGRTGSALNLSASGFNGVVQIFDNQGTWIVGFAFKTSAIFAGGVLNLVEWAAFPATGIVALRITTTGKWEVARDGTILGTGTTTIPINTWMYVEWKVVIHPSAGSYDIRIDGSSVLSGSGVDTSVDGNAYARGLRIGGTTTGTQYHDDLYICDGTGTTNNNFLGDVTVKAILPDSAGNYAQFTPSAGANYQNVDDAAPDGDSTYNGAADAGKKDSYNFGAVGLTGPVLGVQTVLTARKDIGGSKIVKDLVRISGTDYSGSNASLTDAYKMHRQIRELNPATSANWTIAQIDAAEFGVEVVS